MFIYENPGYFLLLKLSKILQMTQSEKEMV